MLLQEDIKMIGFMELFEKIFAGKGNELVAGIFAEIKAALEKIFRKDAE